MMNMRGVRVPRWLYNSVTADIAFQWHGQTELRLVKHLGNAVWNAVMANVLTWLPFIAFSWLVQVALRRRGDGSGHIATLAYFIFVPTIMSNMWLEHKSFKDQVRENSTNLTAEVSKEG